MLAAYVLGRGGRRQIQQLLQHGQLQLQTARYFNVHEYQARLIATIRVGIFGC